MLLYTSGRELLLCRELRADFDGPPLEREVGTSAGVLGERDAAASLSTAAPAIDTFPLMCSRPFASVLRWKWTRPLPVRSTERPAGRSGHVPAGKVSSRRFIWWFSAAASRDDRHE